MLIVHRILYIYCFINGTYLLNLHTVKYKTRKKIWDQVYTSIFFVCFFLLLGQNLGSFVETFLLKRRFFICFVKNLFFGAWAGQSQAFRGGAGAKKKIYGAGAEENGSAPQHCIFIYRYVSLKKTYPICLGQFGRVGTTGVNAFLLCMTMTDTEMLEKTACRSNNKKLVLSVFVEAFNGGLTWQVVGGGRREKDSRFGSQPLIVPDSYQAKNERADK